MKPVERTKYVYMCEYPNEGDVLPEPTVTIAEFTETGLVEAYVLSNAQLDKANLKLQAVLDFIRKAKKEIELKNKQQ